MAFPELEVRQRLTVSTGCGVAEVHVPEGSEFVGQTLVESDLRERDITVLTLRRGNVVIPNPKESRTLEGEDRLLCFGKLEEMRSMIPTRRKRRAKVRKLLDEALPDAD